MGMFDALKSMIGYGAPGTKSTPQTPDRRGPETARSPEKPKDWMLAQKERMDKLWANGEWETVAQDLESILGPEIANTEVVNVGDPEIKGFEREYTGERYLSREKKRCDDRKINDPNRRLFAVLDGVSTGHGAIASEVTSRIVQKRLGEDLNKEVENLLASGKVDEEKINELVAGKIMATVYEAQGAVLRAQKFRADYAGASTTLSVAKIVDMPDGRQRAYYASIGDSRIYLQNGDGRLVQLTKDDSEVNDMIAKGEVELTPEQIDAIDQYVVYNDQSLNDDERAQKQYLVGIRHTITESIGGDGRKSSALWFNPEEPQHSDIRFIDLEPGQRLLLTSDGVHDNSLRSDMYAQMKSGHDAHTAERNIQQAALAVQLEPANDRSKPDDLSAVVYEVGEPVETSEEQPEVIRVERKYNSADVPAWVAQLHALDAAAARGDLSAQQRLTRVNLEHWIAKAAHDDILDRQSEFAAEGTLREGDRIQDFVLRDGKRVLEPFRVTGFTIEKGKQYTLLTAETGSHVQKKVENNSLLLETFAGQMDEERERLEEVATRKAQEYQELQKRTKADELASAKQQSATSAAQSARELRARLVEDKPPSQVERGKRLNAIYAEIEQLTGQEAGAGVRSASQETKRRVQELRAEARRLEVSE